MNAEDFLDKQKSLFASHVDACKRAVSAFADEQFAIAPEPGVWSVGQVFEHLNLSIEPYIAGMGAAAARAPKDGGAEPRKSFLGRFIYGALSEKRAVPVPGGFRPNGLGSRKDYERYLENAERFLTLFDDAKGKDLNGATFQNPILPLFKMNLTDGFSIMTAHGAYHQQQIEERAAKVKG
ncbi:MAG: DinB family protein [Armatimonadetes bacterium]|nr:DinB family protein [Armatimonadota bacterium]MBS1710176.1 DinB family protein [Armatimonadota bacterium]MBX3110066.1 DinB family protein [Fimbriimonadaceae bacterium]